jgi:PAS domain S-box-containing protein
VALEPDELRESPVQAQSRAQLMCRILRQLLTTTDPRAAVQQACREACEFLRCEVFCVYRVDDRTGRLRLEASGGLDSGVARAVEDLDLAQSLFGKAALDGCRVVAEDLADNPDTRCAPLRGCGILACACQPMFDCSGSVFGVLSFGASSRPVFSEEDLALIEDLSRDLAIAILRCRGEQVLRDNDSRFRTWIRASSGAAYRISADWREVQLLEGRAFAADPNGSGLSWPEIHIPRADGLEVRAAIDAALRNRTVFELEHRVRRADGSLGWACSRAVPVCDANGDLVEWIGMTADVTDRRAAQDERDVQADRLALAASGARIGMFEWNLATGRVQWTDQHALLFGLRHGSATHDTATSVAMTSEYGYRDWADRVHPDDLPRVEAEVLRCRVEHAPFEAEYRVVWPDGSVHWIVGRGLFQYDAAGTPQRMFGTAMDITARKQAEQALVDLNATLEHRVAERTEELERAERRSAAILDAAFDAIIAIDEAGSIVTYNRAAERIFGHAAAEAIGRSLKFVLPGVRIPGSGGRAGAAGRTGARDASEGSRELTGRRKDGTEFPARLSVGGVPELGLKVCIVRDVSERRALQREILQISALEQRRIGQELHDGTLQDLAGIGLLAESLSDALRETASPGQELAARLASEVAAVNRAIRLLAEGLVPVAVNSDGLVRALRALARTTERRHGLRCALRLSGDVPMVEDDVAGHLYRIAREAVANAVKHADARNLEIRLERGQDTLHLEVCDDGVGVQPDRPTSSGLGLRTMKYRCALMGGTFTVGPQELGGTRISCAIPLQESSA